MKTALILLIIFELLCKFIITGVTINKCCEAGKVVDLSEFVSKGGFSCKLAIGNESWTPVLYEDAYNPTKDEVIPVQFTHHNPSNFCDDGFLTVMTLKPFLGQAVVPFRILKDGSILEKVGRREWKRIDEGDKLCVDGVQNIPLNEDGTELSGPYTGDEFGTMAIDCRTFLPEDETNKEEIDLNVLYITAMIVSVFFLFLTLLVFLLLWRRQTIRGWTLMGYITFFAIELIFLVIARTTKEYGQLCTISAIGIHFTALATFCWLTVHNFDIWWSFRTMNPCTTKSEERKLFLCYSIFATVIPISIVVVGIVLDHIYRDDAFSEILIPAYGTARCGITPSGELAYLYGPISVLLGINLIFVTLTVYYIYRNQKILKSSGIKTKILNDKLQLFGRLFLIAGITWIFDVISWFATPSNPPSTYTQPWFWTLFDFINILQAIAIFFVYVCNRKTWNDLMKKVGFIKKLGIQSPKNDTSPHNNNKNKSGFPFSDSRKVSITQIYSISDPYHQPETKRGRNEVELR